MKSAAQVGETLGQRLRYVRSNLSQSVFAQNLGVALATYRNYESDLRVPDMHFAAALVMQGWNANWLLTGNGCERLEAQASAETGESQMMRSQELTIAVQLAEEALDGGKLEPDDYAQLVTLIYEALVNGLPSAQVLAFARPAARGLNTGVSSGDDKSSMGKAG